jgi:hypothetical protein
MEERSLEDKIGILEACMGIFVNTECVEGLKDRG